MNFRGETFGDNFSFKMLVYLLPQQKSHARNHSNKAAHNTVNFLAKISKTTTTLKKRGFIIKCQGLAP